MLLQSCQVPIAKVVKDEFGEEKTVNSQRLDFAKYRKQFVYNSYKTNIGARMEETNVARQTV